MTLPTSPSNTSTAGTRPIPSRLAFGRLDLALMVAVLVFYTATRVIGIVDFPIFFFCDEATHGNLAEELLENGLRDNQGNLFPPYFRNAKVYNLGFSVWIHSATVAAFGKSVAVVRLTSVVIGVLGAAALMLALKIGFGIRLWWTAGLVLAAFPGWFLHSRTAFEAVMMVSFYAAFLLAYLLYREVSPRWLPLAIVFGGATFYAYSNGQGVMFVSGLLLLVSDWRYHVTVLHKHKTVVALALITAVIVASPYLRFRFVLHPEMVADHLADLHSYWLQDIPVGQKIAIFLGKYSRGLSPGYWFTEDVNELVRHRMKGYGYLPLWLSPVILLGFGATVFKARRSAAHRLVLVAVLAAPFSASLVDIRITRVLAMMAPAAILAVLGLDCILRWLRRRVPEPLFASVAAAVLVAASCQMTADALRNGPRWFSDYGMGGLQWGASQLFEELERQLEADPKLSFMVSHSWANLPNAFTDFFIDERQRHRIQMAVIDDFIMDYRPDRMNPNQTFVLTENDYRRAISSGMFTVGKPLHVIDNPAGEPAFIFVKLAYSDAAEEIFEAARAERRRPVESTITLAGIETVVLHPRFDIGSVESIFDGDLKTIARTLDADPSVLVFAFGETRPITGIRLTVWTPSYDLRIAVESASGEIVEAEETVQEPASFSEHELLLPAPVGDTRSLTVVIDKHGDVKAHIQELVILP